MPAQRHSWSAGRWGERCTAVAVIRLDAVRHDAKQRRSRETSARSTGPSTNVSMNAARAKQPPDTGVTDMPRVEKSRKRAATTGPGRDSQLPDRRTMEAFLAPLSG